MQHSKEEAKIMNRYNHYNTLYKSDKNTSRVHHIQESQDISLFPAGDHKTAMTRQDSMADTQNTNNKKKPFQCVDMR